MTSALGGRLPFQVQLRAEDGPTKTPLDDELERVKNKDLRCLRYQFVPPSPFFDDQNLLRMEGENPKKAAEKLSSALETYGMNTVEKLELSDDEMGGQKIQSKLEGILKFLAQSPALREFRYESRHKILPPIVVQSLQKNNHFLQKLELRCLYFPIEALCDAIRSTKTIAHLSLDGHELTNRTYQGFRISSQKFNMLCQALAENKSLKEVDFTAMNFDNRNAKHKLLVQDQNLSIKTVRFRRGNADAQSIYNLLHVMGRVEEIQWTFMVTNNILFDAISSLGGKRSLSLNLASSTDNPPEAKLLKKFIATQDGLKSLSITHGSSSALTGILEKQTEALQNHPSLRELKLSGVRDEALQCLFNVPLITLDIWSFTMETALPNLCKIVRKQDCTLQDLTLKVHSMECFSELCLALTKNKSLTSFRLVAAPFLPSHRHISDEGYAALDACLPEISVHKLSLSGTAITGSFCQRFFKTLAHLGNEQLTDLEIESPEEDLFDTESMHYLCLYLQHSACNLSTFTFNRDISQALSSQCMEFFLTTLSTIRTPLEKLTIPCYASDLPMISKFIPKVQTLKSLTLQVVEDRSETWRSERVKTGLLLAIRCSRSLQEFHCNLDEDGYIFQNKLFFFNYRNKVDWLLSLHAESQPPLSLWPHIMEAIQRRARCPSVLFHVLSTQAGRFFASRLDHSCIAQEDHPVEIRWEDIKYDAPPETAPPRVEPVEVGCGCFPVFWKHRRREQPPARDVYNTSSPIRSVNLYS